MAAINHETKIKASPSKVFEALSTLKGLRAWHSTEVEGDSHLNGIITFSANGKPTFQWKVIEMVPNKKVIWECLAGPGDSVGTQTIYALSETEDQRTLIDFSHTTWPNEQGNFRKCNTLWGVLLYHLKNYVEKNEVDPAIK